MFPTSDTWLFILAGIGAALSIARRRRIGEFFAILAVLAALAFRFMPQSILWNARVLPFWFLALYILGGLAVAELYAIMAERTTNFMVTLRAALLPAPLIVLVLVFIWVGFPLRILPGEHATANGNYQFLGHTPKERVLYPGLGHLELQRLPGRLSAIVRQNADGPSTSRSSLSWKRRPKRMGVATLCGSTSRK